MRMAANTARYVASIEQPNHRHRVFLDQRHIMSNATEEPKLDGFRAIAYIEGGTCRLVSRNWNAFKTFAPLAEAIGQELAPHTAILDGEIVRPGPDGRRCFMS